MADRKELKKLLKRANYQVYTKLNSVSRSGMTRHIALLVIVDNMPRYISMSVAEILDYPIAKDGSIKVGGCGMDMGFHLVYRLSCELYCKGEQNDIRAYKLKQRWL